MVVADADEVLAAAAAVANEAPENVDEMGERGEKVDVFEEVKRILRLTPSATAYGVPSLPVAFGFGSLTKTYEIYK